MFFAAARRPRPGARGRHRRRRHPVGGLARRPSTASTTATSTSRCGAPAAVRCRATSSRPRSALVFGVVLGVLATVILYVWVNPLSAALSLVAECVLPLRLHDAAQAPYHPEHRLGRARRLLPGADRLDGRHRRAGVGAGRAVRWSSSSGRRRTPGRWRCATARTTPASTSRCCRWSRRPRSSAARSSLYSWVMVATSLLLWPVADTGLVLPGRGRRARRGLPRRRPTGCGRARAAPRTSAVIRPMVLFHCLEPLPVAAVRGRRARPAAHPLTSPENLRRRRQPITRDVRPNRYDGWPAHGGAGQPSSTSGRCRPVRGPRPAARWRTRRRAPRRACAASTTTTGRPVKYCTKPTPAWSTSTAASAVTGRGVGAGGPQREPHPDREADQQEHQVGVQLAELQRVEPVARRARVAGVRARAGDDGADVEHQPGDGVGRPGERRQHAPAPVGPEDGRAGAGRAPRPR